MGLFADKIKQMEKDGLLHTFRPLELCEMNVQAVFNRCCKKADEEDEVASFTRIMHETTGIEESEVLKDLGVKHPGYYLLPFNIDRLKENSKNISYLFGQLAGVHVRDERMIFEYGVFTYQNKKWTTDVSVLKNFYILGIANRTITHSASQDDKKTLLIDLSHIKPTLSPKDQTFPAWWEAHKAEWEDKA